MVIELLFRWFCMAEKAVIENNQRLAVQHFNKSLQIELSRGDVIIGQPYRFRTALNPHLFSMQVGNAIHSFSNRKTYNSFGPCAPMTNVFSISAVRLGPEVMLSMEGSASYFVSTKASASLIS